MNIPTLPWVLMLRVYQDVIPAVHWHLRRWKELAQRIPNPELRKQALMSIETKTFHCEGGGIYGLLAREHQSEAIDFMVAYQTISDYLNDFSASGSPSVPLIPPVTSKLSSKLFKSANLSCKIAELSSSAVSCKSVSPIVMYKSKQSS